MALPVFGATEIQTISFGLGGTLSNTLDISKYREFAIEIPSTWTAAGLSMLSTATNVPANLKNVYDDAGLEVVITMVAGTLVVCKGANPSLSPLKFVQFRSGVAALPVAQVVAVDLTLICKA